MKKATLKEAITKVLEKETSGLSSHEIYDTIIRDKLYEFKSKTPLSIVNAELRKNSIGIELKKSASKRLFKFVNNKFSLLK